MQSQLADKSERISLRSLDCYMAWRQLRVLILSGNCMRTLLRNLHLLPQLTDFHLGPQHSEDFQITEPLTSILPCTSTSLVLYLHVCLMVPNRVPGFIEHT